MSHRGLLFLITTVAAGGLVPASAAVDSGKSLVELDDGRRTYRGRVYELTRTTCSLVEEDGRMHHISRNRLKGFKKIRSRFRPLTSVDLRTRLANELGRGFSIQTTGHYVVCTPRKSRTDYASVFEDVYRTFHFQFRRRGFRLKEAEFPLVAIVFPDFAAFAEYAKKDGVRASRGLLGYYDRRTNRVAAWESSATAQIEFGPSSAAFGNGGSRELHETIVHETIHQVAFNTGVHPRVGEIPRWIVEGLATALEAPGFRTTRSTGLGASRINRGRYVWFKNFAANRRKDDSLREFIASESAFTRAALDGYSQAWALTYYFLDQPARSHKYSKYLQGVASRDPGAYSSAERIKDFEAAFGDIDRVEMEFLRFMSRLKVEGVASR